MKARKYRLAGKRKPEQDLFFRQALEGRGWKLGDDQHWDTCWFTGMPDPAEFKKVGPGRTINHIPGNNALTIKDRLYESVSKMRDRVSEQFGLGHEAVARLDFLPRVYSMPRDYHRMQQAALDDPLQRWILKPKNASRGRGIRVVSDIASVPMDSSWMVQQYLANPHTMRQRKYVLRLYVLVSSIDPLRFYLHRQGFAKLASAPYDVNDVDNPFSQLTNPDINALNGGAEVPVEFVDLDRYREWLREQGHDDEHLFSQIRDLVTLTVISAVESMRRQSADCGADPRGCYELLGLDCLIDDQLKPWILECNLSPSLGVCAGPDGGADIEERVKAEVVSDTVWLVGMDVDVRPVDGDPAEHIRVQASEEQSRSGGFVRLWPSETPESYLPYFALPRLADVVLADASSATPVVRPQLVARAVDELIVEDRVGLYDPRSGRLDWLNESASLIWLAAMQGADPDAIADLLHHAAAACGSDALPDLWNVRKDVWNCLADWAESGKVMQRTAVAAEAGVTSSAEVPAPSAPDIFTISLKCGAYRLDVHTGSPPVSARLESGLGLLRSDSGDQQIPQLQVILDTPGYTLVLDGDVIASRITLAAVVPAIVERLMRMAADDDEFSLDVGLLTGQVDAGPVGLALIRAGQGDGFGLQVAARLAQHYSRGVLLDAFQPDQAASLGLPGRQGTEWVPANPESISRSHGVDAVVICRAAPAPNAGVISVLSTQAALGELLPLCSTRGRPIGASTVSALVEWLENRRLYALDISDYETAFQGLHQLVHEAPVARASAHCDSIRVTQELTA